SQHCGLAQDVLCARKRSAEIKLQCLIGKISCNHARRRPSHHEKAHSSLDLEKRRKPQIVDSERTIEAHIQEVLGSLAVHDIDIGCAYQNGKEADNKISCEQPCVEQCTQRVAREHREP